MKTFRYFTLASVISLFVGAIGFFLTIHGHNTLARNKKRANIKEKFMAEMAEIHKDSQD